MEKMYEISLLLDFYGQLLTKRQYEILDLYYNNDYSLGEISELLEISRQGVHDNIKRGLAVLDKYEKEMLLLDKYRKNKNTIETLLELINDLDTTDMSNENKDKIMKIRSMVIEFSSEF